MCEICYVDEAIKGKIIARNSEFHKVASSPFGEDDEVGMLNLIDAESRTAILRRADPTKVYDLSVDHFIGMPGWTGAGDQPYQIWMTHTPQGEIVGDSMKKGKDANALVAYSGDGISMYTHCGTHIDTFNHFGYDGAIFNNFTAHDHLGSRAWRKCGAETQPPIFARGILLDIARFRGVDWLKDGEAIGNDELDACAKKEGVAIGRGDFVIVRTGQMERCLAEKKWGGYAGGDAPGVKFENCYWCQEKQVAAICMDTWGCEVRPNETTEANQPWHWVVIPAMGLCMGEIFYLKELADDCENDGVYEFFFCGPPLIITGGTGSPINPQAIK